ncbi:MAG: ribonuclease III [Bryobacteraceae bacterium]|nr:ribonuclease III [Bryobacteraceae bacterium]
MPAADLQELEAKLGHKFRDHSLLVRALTHKSFSSEAPAELASCDNEQLEFFGDSILGFLVSEMLITEFSSLPEGELSRAKSYLVSARWLHQVARQIGLGEYLNLGKGEEHSGGRVKASLLSNAIEALIAALYLDAGLDQARQFVTEYIYSTETLNAVEQGEHSNFKGELWEKAGAEKLPRPEYRVVQTSGPAHAPAFVVEARLGKLFSGTGEGPSKKVAEQNAARALLDAMGAASKEANG